jgi:hypothetical protein
MGRNRQQKPCFGYLISRIRRDCSLIRRTAGAACDVWPALPAAVKFGSIGSLKQELQLLKRVRLATIGSQRFPVLGRKYHHRGRRDENSTKLDGSMRQPIRAVEGKAEPSRHWKLRTLDRVNDFVVGARHRACQSPHQVANTVQKLLAVKGLSRKEQEAGL